MTVDIPIRLRGQNERLTVVYEENADPAISGFDALDVPFEKEKCVGYPTMHAYFKAMELTGYKRFCGFIQLVERLENGRDSSLSIDADRYALEIGNPYFSYGYPACLYDAPCMNQNGCDALLWRAYTYLVDMPTRMNGNRLQFIAGFSWGYSEDREGVRLLPLEMLTEADFHKHRACINARCPRLEG